MNANKQQELDDAIIEAVESGRLGFKSGSTIIIKVSGNLFLEYEAITAAIALSDFRWVLKKREYRSVANHKYFYPGKRANDVLNKLRAEHLKHLEKTKEAEDSKEYDDIIDEIKNKDTCNDE